MIPTELFVLYLNNCLHWFRICLEARWQVVKMYTVEMCGDPEVCINGQKCERCCITNHRRLIAWTGF